MSKIKISPGLTPTLNPKTMVYTEHYHILVHFAGSKKPMVMADEEGNPIVFEDAVSRDKQINEMLKSGKYKR